MSYKYIDNGEFEYKFEINNTKYLVEFSVYENHKTSNIYVGFSGDKKRKKRDSFSSLGNKNGLKPLIKAKEIILNFVEWYNETYIIPKTAYLCIGWSDNRRKKIYSRLLRDGFKLSKIGNEMLYVKKYRL